MRILYVEEWSDAANSLIQQLHRETGCRIEHADTVDEAMTKIELGHGNIDLVIWAANPADDVLGFSERIRITTSEALIRRPHCVVIPLAPLSLPIAVKCMDRQIICLVRDYPKQITGVIRALLCKIRSSKPGPTIRVVFDKGHYRFFVCGPTTSEELAVSAQIGKLLLLLLEGVRTVDLLADNLGVSRVSVKKYILELRLALASLLQQMNMQESTVQVLWMRRAPGGTLCGLNANAVWE
jgi:hypothetical protein